MKGPRRRPWWPTGLRARVLLVIAGGAALGGALVVWLGLASYAELAAQLEAERQVAAGSIAAHLDDRLSSLLQELTAVGGAMAVDPGEVLPEKSGAALHQVWLHGHSLLEGVFLVDADGHVLFEEPDLGRRSGREVGGLSVALEAVRGGRPLVTGLGAGDPSARRLFAVAPLERWGVGWRGAAVAVIDPRSGVLREILRGRILGPEETIDLVDDQGWVFASTDRSRFLVEEGHARFARELARGRRTAAGTCRGCHEGRLAPGHADEVVVFAPLASAPWAVVMRQPEASALASAKGFLRSIALIGAGLFATALVFGLGATRFVVRSLAALDRSAERIAEGDLSKPVPTVGADEVGGLGRSLERMRVALKESLERIERANEELEARVRERTVELEKANRLLQERGELKGQLLRQVIRAQEDERKRIARELHDETSSSLAALVLRLEVALSEVGDDTRGRLADLKSLAVHTLDEVHRLIRNLRPSVLDDLGLQSAVKWSAEQLERAGIAVRCEFSGLDARFAPEVETALFRVVQEALTNIARHAQAETVLVQVTVRGGAVAIEIEDDGVGFDPKAVAPTSAGGLGLMGMRERVELLGGSVQIDSTPGAGTRIALTVPVAD